MTLMVHRGGSVLSRSTYRWQQRYLPVLHRYISASRQCYKRQDKRRYAVHDRQIETRKARSAYAQKHVYDTFEERRGAAASSGPPGYFVPPHQAQNFVNDLREVGIEASGRAASYEEALFRTIRDKHRITEDDAIGIAVVLRDSPLREDNVLAESIFLTLSLGGHLRALAFVVGQRLFWNRMYPEKSTFKDSPRIKQFREAIFKRLIEFDDRQSLELELRLRVLENPVTALQLLEQFTNRIQADWRWEIGYPWRWLDGVFLRQYEQAVARMQPDLARQILERLIRTADVGVTHDDAYACYIKADYVQKLYVTDERRKIDQGQRRKGPVDICREWLYYMNRAGATGYVPAATALADFYAKHLDKWLDEGQSDEKETFVSRCLRAFGISPNPQDDLESIARQSVVLNNANTRIRMALHWHEVAASFGYAPAYLSIARLRFTPTFKGADGKKEIENPQHDKSDGVYALAKVWQALRAYDVYKDLKSSNQGRVSYEDAKVQREFDQSINELSFASDPVFSQTLKEGIWSFALPVDVFNSWIRDAKTVEALENGMETLADENGCDIKLDDTLLYEHKKPV